MEKYTAPVRLVGVAIMSYLLLFAFSSDSWKKIMDRDGWACRTCSATKKKGYTLMAAHIMHNRDNPQYDSPSNGKALCVRCHRRQHQTMAGRNGLSLEHNDQAINALTKKIHELEEAHKPV